MILVTVGNATQPFGRLLDGVEALAAEGAFGDEPVLIQCGNNPGFQSAHCELKPFLPMEEFAKLIGEASLVICHAGAGTLLHVLETGSVPVVMPRRGQYGELVDDHQVELVQALAAEDRVIPALEPPDLAAAVRDARQRGDRPAPRRIGADVGLVEQAIRQLMEDRT